MIKIPNASKARVDRDKIVNYLLSTTHPDGQSKARFFIRFGFSAESWYVLANALLHHCASNPVIELVRSEYGVRYVVEGAMLSPDKRNPRVRTVWLIEKSGTFPRLITAHPV